MSEVTSGRDLVTPEAVLLDLPLVSVGTRAVALLIDLAIQSALLLMVLLGAGLFSDMLQEWVGVVLVLLGLFAVLFGYPAGFETLTRGRTPGKAAMGVRVLTVEAAPVGFRHAAIRAALGLIDFYLTLGGAAVLSALVTPKGQRLGDLAAGTIVIRDRTRGQGIEAATFLPPPGDEEYVDRLDVSAVSEDDYVAVRSLLVRNRNLDPRVAGDLARAICEPLLTRVVPPPPPGMPPERWLACVAAAYQRRHRSGFDLGVADRLWASLER